MGVCSHLGHQLIPACVCGRVSQVCRCDACSELLNLGQFLSAVDATVAVVSIFGSSNLLGEVYAAYIGSGNQQRLIDFPTSTLRLLKRCMQKASSSVFGSLNAFFMTNFHVTRLKGAENWDWMTSRTVPGKVMITGDLSLPGLLEVVANNVRVWPLIVSYLKETGKTNDGDSFVL